MSGSAGSRNEGNSHADRLRRALAQAVDLLVQSGYRFAIIGGLAVQVRGRPRFTRDVYLKVLVTDTDYESARSIIRQAYPDRARPGLPPDPLVVDALVDGIAVDFLLTMPGYEQNIVTRATQVTLVGVEVWVCSAEDLLVQKAVAGRDKDWFDIEGVLAEQHGKLDHEYIEDWVGQFAELLEEPERLERYLAIKERVEELAQRAGL